MNDTYGKGVDNTIVALGVLSGHGKDVKSTYDVPRRAFSVPDAWVECVMPGLLPLLATMVSRRGRAATEDANLLIDDAVLTLTAVVEMARSVWLAAPAFHARYGDAFWFLHHPGVDTIMRSSEYVAFAGTVAAVPSTLLCMCLGFTPSIKTVPEAYDEWYDR